MRTDSSVFVRHPSARRLRWLFQIYWSEEILEETQRNLVAKLGLTDQQAASRCNAMRKHFREAMVTGYEPYIAAMENDPKDRHVAAAALKAGAQVIVTSNMCDFKKLPEGIEAQSPDEFLCNLFGLSPSGRNTRTDPSWSSRKRRQISSAYAAWIAASLSSS